MSQDRVKIAPLFFKDQTTGIISVRKNFLRLKIPALDRSTGETSLSKARRKAQDLIRDHQNFYLGIDRNNHSMRVGKSVGELIQEVLRTVTPSRRKGTQDMHRFYLGELLTYWRGWDVNRVTRQSWQRYVEGLKANSKRKTFGDYSKHMNLVLSYAYEQKHATHLVKVPNPDAKRVTSFRVYTNQELEALWNHMGEDLRDQFVLAVECYMRLREALKLEWDRVNLQTGVITLRPEDVKTGSKTGRGRSFRMSDHTLRRMRARAKSAAGSPWVFPSPDNPSRCQGQNKTAWNKTKRRAGIKGRARWHDLRHTSLSKALLEKLANPVLVSEYSGVSLKTLQKVYLHSTASHTQAVAGAVSVGKCGKSWGTQRVKKKTAKK